MKNLRRKLQASTDSIKIWQMLYADLFAQIVHTSIPPIMKTYHFIMSSSIIKLDHLQGLRGIAILAVVMFHFFPKLFVNGYLGVDVFFLLSAYLMTMMLRRQDDVNFTVMLDFWYRRIKRIAPLYYLIIAVLLVLLRFCESSLKSVNYKSATTAALFATNHIRPTGIEGYFEKLGVAVDMFTHTWSLAVEIQFYIIFPFIFLICKILPVNRSYFFIYTIRMFSFLCANDKFASKNTAKDNQKNDTINYCIGCLLLLLFYPTAVTSNFARNFVTILTTIILQRGDACSVLKIKSFVFLDEFSYSWYIVHLPIVAFTRLEYGETQIIAMLLSFLIAYGIHICFEVKYIKWKKTEIITALFVLILVVSGQLLVFKNYENQTALENHKVVHFFAFSNLMSKDNYPSDFLGDIIYGYENKSIDERILLNELNDASDIDRTFNSFCKKVKKVSNPTEHRCEMNEGANKTSNYKLLVVGNSYSSNIMPVLAEECRHNFSHLEISTMGGCESLVHSKSGYYDCSYDSFFVDAVKEVKPDVLFVINRHIQMMEIKNGTNPFDDEHFKTASERLSEMQKHVSRRIFILDAFPKVSNSNLRLTNYHLKTNEAIDDTKMVVMTENFLTARLRLSRLVEHCPKCRLFDFASQFFIDGHFKTYDPKYFVSFFTKGLHLTPPG